MRARTAEPSTTGVVMPRFLAAGPALEDWAEPGARMPQWSALRRWQRAVRVWGADAGLTGRDLLNVENMARTRTAWSRSWLVEDGRSELAAWYGGTRDDEPEHTGWRPRVPPGVVEPVEAPSHVPPM